jgi:hypothetical protein
VVDSVLASGGRALHDVLDSLGDAVAVLPVLEPERTLLHDWDSPLDLLG